MTFESIRWVISSSIYIFFLKSELQARAKALNTNAIVPDYIGRYYLLDSRSKALECNNQQISRGLWGVLQTRWWCNFRPFCLSNLWQLENCSLAHLTSLSGLGHLGIFKEKKKIRNTTKTKTGSLMVILNRLGKYFFDNTRHLGVIHKPRGQNFGYFLPHRGHFS